MKFDANNIATLIKSTFIKELGAVDNMHTLQEISHQRKNRSSDFKMTLAQNSINNKNKTINANDVRPINDEV